MEEPKICVSIGEREIKKVIESSEKAKELGADLLELRLDFLGNLNEVEVEEVTKTIKKFGLPIILTIRKEDCGGFFLSKKETDEQMKLLLSGAKWADFVDIELETSKDKLRSFVREVRNIGKKVIVSSHNLKETPSLGEILKLLEKENEVNADICKFVCQANKLEDNLVVLSANLKFKGKKLLFCSGAMGRASRILAPLFGSEWTFASLKKGREVMSGQIDISATRVLLDIMIKDMQK